MLSVWLETTACRNGNRVLQGTPGRTFHLFHYNHNKTDRRQVVCMETFYDLYGGRGGAEQMTNVRLKGRARKANETAPGNRGNQTNSSNSDINGGSGRSSGSGKKKDFVVPQPSRYVPDWAAFGSGKRKKHGSSKQRASSAQQGESGEVWYDTPHCHRGESYSYPPFDQQPQQDCKRTL